MKGFGQASTQGRRRGRSVSALAAAAVAATTVAGTASAQGSDLRLEEVIVTAQKRGAQVLQDVPSQIQAFTSQQIEDYLATEFVDLATQVPSLQFQDLGPGDKEYIIRGVNSTATATVGVYYDEAVITARTKQDGGGRQADIELHDLERVEVLKGPQGTLYGASSMSGTIRFIPNKPDPSGFDANVEAQIADTENGEFGWHVDGMVNIPVIEDKLALRGVGWVTEDGGFVDNVRLGNDDINDNEVEGGRLAALWQPTSNVTITAFGVIQNRDVGGTSRQMPFLQPQFRQNLEAFNFPVFPVSDRDTDSFTMTRWDEDLRLWGVKGEYESPWGSFLIASNWFEREVDFNFDSTPILLFFGVPVPAITNQPQERELFTTEVRFASALDGPVQFVIGGFISDEDKSFASQVVATGPDGEPLAPFQPGDPNTFFGRDKFDQLEQLAIFGEVEWTVNEQLSLLFGGRYYDFEIDSENIDTQPFTPRPLGGFEPTFSVSDDKFTVKTNATWRFTEDKLVYFTAAQGFRPGGTNDVAFVPEGDPVPPAGFGPDELWNFEIGWKTEWYDGRVQLNGAVFAIRWDDIQVETFDPDSPFNVVRNEGEASIDGVEFELRARPLTGLDVFFGGSWQDARFTSEIPGAGPGSAFADSGDDIPNVPEFQFAASGQYVWPLFGPVEGLVRAEWSYRDDTLTAPNDPVLNVDLASFHLVNLRAGVQNDAWAASVFVKNVFDDEDAMFDAINTTQDPRGILTARPRIIGVNFKYSF